MAQRARVPVDRGHTNPVKAAVLACAESGVEWNHLLTLLERLEAQPELDAGGSWDEHGNGLLNRLLACYRTRGERVPSLDVLEFCRKADPETMARTGRFRESATIRWMDLLADRDHSAQVQLPWLIEHGDRAQLLEWARPNHSDRSGSRGTAILSEILNGERSYHHQETRIGLLFKHLGIDPNIRYANGDAKGRPVCAEIGRADQWEAFLTAGGDPRLRFMTADDTPTPTCLWQQLWLHGASDLTKAVESWAEQNEKKILENRRIDLYWEALRRVARYCSDASDLVKAMTSHADWASLRDAQGRNCTMYAVGSCTQSNKALEQKRFKPLLGLRDHRDFGLWHYAVQSSKPESVRSVLKQAEVSAAPSAHNGRGLMACALLEHGLGEDGPGAWSGAMSSGVANLLRHSSGHDVWACDANDARAMSQKLARLLADGGLARLSGPSLLLKQHAEHIEDPLLLGMVVLFNPNEEALVKDCFARGARFEADPQIVTALAAHCSLSRHEDLLRMNGAANEALRLDRETPGSQTGRGRAPGLRL